MKPIRFGKPQPTKRELTAATAYWRFVAAKKPVPPGPPPGAWVAGKPRAA